MKLVGEVYRLPCPRCNTQFEIVLKPQANNNIEPMVIEEPINIPIRIIRTSHISCPYCSANVTVVGELLFVVGDVDEFDEIEQHK